jgi:adenosine deaminase
MKTNIDPNYPLVDLHHHIEGSVRLETILDLGRKHNLPLPAWELEELRPSVQVSTQQPGVLAFLEKFKWTTGILVDADACRRIAYENVEDAKNEGIDYIELRFSPWFMAEANGLNPVAVVEAVIDGVRAAERDTGLRANLIGIISRTYGPETGWKELQALLQYRAQITALDLAGDEVHWPGSLFIDHFRAAWDAGWHVTVHAGESAGPESIWQALNELGAERLGHAVHAPEDRLLMDSIRHREVAIETNLTSNVQTSTVKDYASHPLRLFLEYSLCATINTDDPGISNINLAYEYDVAAPQAGIDADQIRLIQRNGLEAAFLSLDEKRALIEARRVNPRHPIR